MSAIALQCNDCGAKISAITTGQREVQVRHTREKTTVKTDIDTDVFSAAVTRHRARGCPARHFREMPADEQ